MGDKPFKTIRVGGISFSIWVVQREGYQDINIKFDGKSYKDKDGNWQKTYHLFKSDLIKLELAVRRLIDWAYSENIFKEMPIGGTEKDFTTTDEKTKTAKDLVVEKTYLGEEQK